MKKLALLPLFAVSFLALSASARAAEVTITGVGACAKCVLSLTSKCQNAITVTDKDGKKEVVLLEHNTVSKDYHDVVCQNEVKTTATGTIAEAGGKKTLTPTKIEEAKK